MMVRAIHLAKQGQFTTSPNPNVGCVIVKNNQIIGEGAHFYAGGPHAEVNALKQAMAQAEGATCYVTLEPCSHYGRTPPCAKTLVDAKVARVVVAMVDPNPQVSGRGLSILTEAGISVDTGLLTAQAEALNPGFIKRMKTGLPFLTAKLAISLDGKVALENGLSKWITGPEARNDVQLHRAQSCAILSGADTVLQDDAKLNVRWQTHLKLNAIDEQLRRQPVRIIIDSQHRLTPDLALFSVLSKIVLVRTKPDNQSTCQSSYQWPEHVEEVELEANSQGKVDLTALLTWCGAAGLNNVWLEAGATLCGQFMQQNLVDELILYQATKLLGDKALDMLTLAPISDMENVLHFSKTELTQVGDDMKYRLIPQSKR